MALLELNRDPSKKELRWFAGLWFPALCAMVGIAVLRKSHAPTVAVAIWVVAAVLSIAGLCSPRVIRPIYAVLIRVTFPIGWVLSHVLLLVIYYVVFAPVGLLVRRLQDPMQRRFDPSAKSYWTPHLSSSSDRYLRQL